MKMKITNRIKSVCPEADVYWSGIRQGGIVKDSRNIENIAIKCEFGFNLTERRI